MCVGDAERPDLPLELRRAGYHVRQRGSAISDRIDVEEARPGQTCLPVPLARIASLGRQKPARIEQQQVGGRQLLSQPWRAHQRSHASDLTSGPRTHPARRA